MIATGYSIFVFGDLTFSLYIYHKLTHLSVADCNRCGTN